MTNAAARAYSAKKAEGENDAELLTAARTSFRVLEEKDRLDPELRTLWSVTEQWAGAPAEAVNVLVRALQKNPDDQALLGALVDTALAQKQLPLAIEALQARDDATGLWYLGRARYLLASAHGDTGRNDEALALLDQAQQSFEASMQKNPAFRDSCEQWIAMCLGKKGNIAFTKKDVEDATRWLLASAKMRPDRIAEDLRTQYALGYVSNNPSRDGGWRRIAIATERGNLQLRHRLGYYAGALRRALLGGPTPAVTSAGPQ